MTLLSASRIGCVTECDQQGNSRCSAAEAYLAGEPRGDGAYRRSLKSWR
ncbi:MAG: hypothetical protein R3C99_07240 [Pirellulaceae bacterium]